MPTKTNVIEHIATAIWIPGLTDILSKTFPNISFFHIPIKGRELLINDDVLEKIEDYEFLLADPTMAAKLISLMPRLKWFQCISAGMDAFFANIDKSQISQKFLVTKMSGVYGPIMAEYIVAQIVARERHLYQIYDNQKEKKWEYLDWNYRSLSDLCIGVMGLGDIGTSISKCLHHFGPRIVGFAKSREKINSIILDPKHSSVWETLYWKESLPDFLAECDYIISMLPSTPQTKGLLDQGQLKNAIHKKPVFINLGRSDLVCDSEIVKAIEFDAIFSTNYNEKVITSLVLLSQVLGRKISKGNIRNKWISGAILDVFDKEPLPPDSPLWHMKEVIITPHLSAMCKASTVIKVLKTNKDRYENGEPLIGLVDFEKEY